jgi:transposase-like protein
MVTTTAASASASASPATRRSYTADFKLRVVRELTAPTASQEPRGAQTPAAAVRALAARHGITPTMLRKWVSRRAELEAAVLERRALPGGSALAPLRKLGSGRRSAHRELDTTLTAPSSTSTATATAS